MKDGRGRWSNGEGRAITKIWTRLRRSAMRKVESELEMTLVMLILYIRILADNIHKSPPTRDPTRSNEGKMLGLTVTG